MLTRVKIFLHFYVNIGSTYITDSLTFQTFSNFLLNTTHIEYRLLRLKVARVKEGIPLSTLNRRSSWGAWSVTTLTYPWSSRKNTSPKRKHRWSAWNLAWTSSPAGRKWPSLDQKNWASLNYEYVSQLLIKTPSFHSL